ncbi:MAG: histidine phosphatase family protein [Ktedonobacterales bacterium]
MVERIVYFVRHGENTANLTREFSHRLVDYSLTARGEEQARCTARRFIGERIGAVYASPLKRAHETAAIVAEPLGLPVTSLEDLREVNVGTLEGQPPTDALWALHDGVFAAWGAGLLDTAFPEGEDQRALEWRLRRAVGVMLRAGAGAGQAIAVTHGGILAAALPALCPGASRNALISLWLENCSVTEVRFRREDGAALVGEIVRWGDCAHLG